MPIYEYQCGACGERCEFMQKMTAEPKTECPHCKENQLKKLISSTSFQLKGSGWYVTDFKDKGKSKKKEGDKTEKSVNSGDKKKSKDSGSKSKEKD